MNLKTALRKIAPYAAAIAVFAIVSAIYFSPQFSGRALPMHDVMQYKGMTEDIKESREALGTDPGWTGRMFGGMPAYFISVKYPAMFIKSATSAVQTFFGQPWAFILAAMVSFWILLLLCGINPWVGIIPSLAYGLSTYFFIIIGAGHITKMWALAYAPLLIGGVIYAYRRNVWTGGALAALFAAIEIGAGHPQITYYFCFIIAALVINELVKAIREHTMPHFAKATGVLIIAAILAVGANFSSLYFTATHSKETTRGGSEIAQTDNGAKGLDLQYATAWSYGRGESFNMLIPDFKGQSSNGGFSSDGQVAETLSKYGARSMTEQLPSYWGDQPYTAGPTYIGAVAIFLALLGMFTLKGSKKWWLFAVTVLAILLSWGSNMMWFTELAFKIIPGYDKFRTVSMILVIVEFAIPLLAAFTLADIFKGETDRAKLMRGIWWSLGIAGGISLIFALLGSNLFDFSSQVDSQLPEDVANAMRSERASMLRADAWRSFLLIAITAGMLIMYAYGKLRTWATGLLCGAMVCLDMIPVDLRYLPHSLFKNQQELQIQPTEADKAILQDKELGFRVLNMAVSPFNDATTSYFHRSVGGYHGAKLSRYQDIIDRYLSQSVWPVYDMLNTKYVIQQDQKTGEYTASLNPEAFGAAWFIEHVQEVSSPKEEIDALGKIDLRGEAAVDKRFAKLYETATTDNADTSATISLEKYSPNYLQYKSSSATDKIAVFSEIYYPDGWTVTIDGKPAEYFRADYILRAMVIPAGQHTIEWQFTIPKFRTAETVTLVCSILIVLALAAAATVTIMKRKKTE